MGIEYFGAGVATGAFYGDMDTYRNKATNYTCPGSGNMTLVSLGAYCKKDTGAAGNVRVAIYNTSLDLIAQGSAEISVTSTSASWIEHTSFTDSAGTPVSPVLTGGTNYILIIARDSVQVLTEYDIVSSGNMATKWDEYTGGFPATFVDSADSTIQYNVRCGVEAAGGGHPAMKRFGGVPHVAVNRGVW
jgi:hypothetical protein